jgi:hypothetical protein
VIGYAIIALGVGYFLVMKWICDWLEKHRWKRDD